MPVQEQKTDRNRLLRALDAEDYRWITPQLESVDLKSGHVLAEENQPFTHVYFMDTGVVSITNTVSGGTVEVGTVGNEGLAGLSVYLDGGAGIPSRTFVQVPGAGRRIPAAAFAARAEARTSLQKVLNRYAQAYLIQVAQTAACNRAHSVEERCARWLLMTHDRVGGSQTFPLTHQFLSYMLGVRRAGVTVAAGILQKAGLISYTRGSITISDRAGLEAAACECYAIVAGHVERLTSPGH